MYKHAHKLLQRENTQREATFFWKNQKPGIQVSLPEGLPIQPLQWFRKKSCSPISSEFASLRSSTDASIKPNALVITNFYDQRNKNFPDADCD